MIVKQSNYFDHCRNNVKTLKMTFLSYAKVLQFLVVGWNVTHATLDRATQAISG